MRSRFALWLGLCFSFIICYSQKFDKDSLLGQLKRAADDTNKVNLYRNLGVSVAHKDPNEAIVFWKKGVELAKELRYDLGLARCYVNIAAGYSFAAKYDSSLIYIDTAIAYAHKVGDVSRLALVYLNRADAFIRIQNFTDAMKDCNTALRYAEQANNTDRLARIYHNISDIYHYQGQYNQAITYLEKSVSLYRNDENMQMLGLAHSDKAAIFLKMGATDRAIEGYRTAIRVADSVKDFKNLSAYHADLADIYISQNRLAEAEKLLAKAMKYALEPENILQQAITQSHYSKLYARQNKKPEALQAALLAYNLAKEEEDILWQKIGAGLVSDAYRSVGNMDQAYAYLQTSNALNDTLLRQQFHEETANQQARFEVGQKDKEIQLLSKDKELKDQQLKQQRFFLFTSFAIALLALLGIVLLVNRARLRQRMKELELRNRIAADLHDEVGSSLSSIYILSQIAAQQPGVATGQMDVLSRVHDNARETMDKMSDIVWMIKPVEEEASSLKQKLERFASEVSNNLGIDISMEIGTLERIKLNMEQRKNIYLVIKEAVNNSVKYASTERIDITAALENKFLVVQIEDYGKGFESLQASNGNGLSNMKKRAEDLGGRLEIHSVPGKGTSVKLSVPV